MPTPFWHSQRLTDGLKRLDRPGFAVEFLRRNPRYRDDYTSGIPPGVLETRWGLLFRA